MSEYRKKPVVIEAVQWHGEANCEEVFAFLGMEHPPDELDHSKIHIPTLEGVMTASVGDWVIRGVRGEFYPCKDEIFKATYEPADVPPAPEIDLDDLAQALAAVEDAPTGGTTPERYSAWCRVRRAVEIARAKAAGSA